MGNAVEQGHALALPGDSGHVYHMALPAPGFNDERSERGTGSRGR